jgi:single-stranded DNA-binding protein
VILIGNATRAAAPHHTQNGKAVSSVCMTTNRVVKGEEEIQFHTIIC